MDVLESMRSMLRHHDRELTCANCGTIMATVALHPLGRPKVVDTRGADLAPTAESLMRQVMRTRIATASRIAADPVFPVDPDLPRFVDIARRQLRYLDNLGGEPVYELLCTHCGATCLRSMPHLAKAVRGARARQVPVR